MYIGQCQIDLFCLFKVIHDYIKLEYIERHVNENLRGYGGGIGGGVGG